MDGVLFMKKNTINDNFINILTYIQSSDQVLSYYDLIQYCIDYDQYKELYLNYHVFKDLMLEHNKKIQETPKVTSESAEKGFF